MAKGEKTGVVKWFAVKLGYGFIVDDYDGKDVFVHYSAITGSGYRILEEGEPVTFDVINGDRGLLAKNVQRLVRGMELREHGGLTTSSK